MSEFKKELFVPMTTYAEDAPLSALAVTDRLFFERADSTLTRDEAEKIVTRSLEGIEDGELFLEYRESESIVLDDGVIRSASFDTSSGFGLRSVIGPETGFAHSDEISKSALERAASAVSVVRQAEAAPSRHPLRPQIVACTRRKARSLTPILPPVPLCSARSMPMHASRT